MNIIILKQLLFSILLSVLTITCKNVVEPPQQEPNQESLGIYSETPDYLEFDVDSFIGTFSGNNAVINEFIEDTKEKKEGERSLKATVSVNALEGGYAGWFISWGKKELADNNSHVKNMEYYKNGRLIFWVKSPINLEVGIRSGDVQAGKEKSKILLSSVSNFESDNEWHQICIPLSAFQGSYLKADLSKIKVFFVVSSNTPSGGTEGSQKSFWIDDVRWESQSCP